LEDFSIGRRGCGGVITVRTKGSLNIRGNNVAGSEESLVILTSHYARTVGAMQQVINEKARDLKARVRSDGTWHAQWCAALYAIQAIV
jgi:hypothetical protein